MKTRRDLGIEQRGNCKGFFINQEHSEKLAKVASEYGVKGKFLPTAAIGKLYFIAAEPSIGLQFLVEELIEA